MKTYDNLYEYLYSMGNLTLAWRKARKGKIKNKDVVEFEKNLEKNLLDLHYELKNKAYKPELLTTFVLRDPKTRVISKSDFRDRVVHHALILTIGKYFENQFIYDSCANQIGKGNLFAIQRFRKFSRKVSRNFTSPTFCLKADIRHYFQKVNHEVLINIISRKIRDENVLWLIGRILNNCDSQSRGGERLLGMPLGNYTSQFFANVYLNKLDYFVKHVLKAKYYIRYVDDFVILHRSKKQLEIWKRQIGIFLKDELKIELHPQKSKIGSLYNGVDFVGFRIFPRHMLLRKRNVRSMKRKIGLYESILSDFGFTKESYQGWQAYAKWADTYKLRQKIKMEIINAL